MKSLVYDKKFMRYLVSTIKEQIYEKWKRNKRKGMFEWQKDTLIKYCNMYNMLNPIIDLAVRYDALSWMHSYYSLFNVGIPLNSVTRLYLDEPDRYTKESMKLVREYDPFISEFICSWWYEDLLIWLSEDEKNTWFFNDILND